MASASGSIVARQLDALCDKLNRLSSLRRRRRRSWTIAVAAEEAPRPDPQHGSTATLASLLPPTTAAFDDFTDDFTIIDGPSVINPAASSLIRFLTPRLFVEQLAPEQRARLLGCLVRCVTSPVSGATDLHWLVRLLAAARGGFATVRDLSAVSPFFASALTLISNLEDPDEVPIVMCAASHLYAAGITCRALKHIVRLAQRSPLYSIRAAALSTMCALSDPNARIGEQTSHNDLRAPGAFFGFSGAGDGLSIQARKWPFKQRDFSFWTRFRAERFDALSSVSPDHVGDSPLKNDVRKMARGGSTSSSPKPKRRGFFGNSSTSSTSSGGGVNAGTPASGTSTASSPTPPSSLDMDPIHDAFQHLFLIVTNDGHYIDIGFQGNMLAVRTRSGPKNRTQQHVVSSLPLIERTWYQVGVVCVRPGFFRGTELRVFINGKQLGASIPFAFPKPPSTANGNQLRACHFGLHFAGQLGPTYLLTGAINEHLAELMHDSCVEGIDSALDMLPPEVRSKVLFGFHPRCHLIDAEDNMENLINQRRSTFANIGHSGTGPGSAAASNSKGGGGSGGSGGGGGGSSGSSDSFCGTLIGNAYSWTLSTVRDVLCSTGGITILLPLLARCSEVLLHQRKNGQLPDMRAACLSARVLRLIANMLRGHAVNHADAMHSRFVSSIGHLLGENMAALSHALSTPAMASAQKARVDEIEELLDQLASDVASAIEIFMEAVAVPTLSRTKSASSIAFHNLKSSSEVELAPGRAVDAAQRRRNPIEAEVLEHVAFNFTVWSQAPEKVQVAVIQMLAKCTHANPLHFRRAIGVQHLLDAVREHYSADASLYRSAAAAATAAATVAAATHNGLWENHNRDEASPVRRGILKIIGLQLLASRSNETAMIKTNEVMAILQFIVDAPCAAAIADILSLLHVLMSQPQPPRGLFPLLSVLSTSKTDRQDDRSGLAFPFFLLGAASRLVDAYERGHIPNTSTTAEATHEDGNIGYGNGEKSILLLPAIMQVIGIYLSRWDSCGAQQRKRSGKVLFATIGTEGGSFSNDMPNAGGDWKGSGSGSITQKFCDAGGFVLLSQLLDKPGMGQSCDGSTVFGSLLDMMVVGDRFLARHLQPQSSASSNAMSIMEMYAGAGGNILSQALMDDSEIIVNPGAVLVVFRFLARASCEVLGQALQLLLLLINLSPRNRRTIASQTGWQHGLFSLVCSLATTRRVWSRDDAVEKEEEEQKRKKEGASQRFEEEEERSQLIAMTLKLLGLLVSEDFLHNPDSWTNLLHFAALTRRHLQVRQPHGSGTTTPDQKSFCGKIISGGENHDISYVSLMGELCIQIAKTFSLQFREHIKANPEAWHKPDTSFGKNANRIKGGGEAMASLIMESMVLVDEPGVAVSDRFLINGPVNGSNASVNLINFAAFVESVIMECRPTFDGRVTELPPFDGSEENKNQNSADADSWVSLPSFAATSPMTPVKSRPHQGDNSTGTGCAPTQTPSQSRPDSGHTAHMGNAQSSILLNDLFKTLEPILHSPSAVVRNKVLWTICGDESGAAFGEHGPLVFVLLRMALLRLDILPPHSDSVVTATQSLSVLVKALLVNPRDRGRGVRVKSLSSQFDDTSRDGSRASSPTMQVRDGGSGGSGGRGSAGRNTRGRRRSLSDEDFALLVRAAVTPLASHQSAGSAGLQKKESMDGTKIGVENMAKSPETYRRGGAPIALEEEEQWMAMTALYIHKNLSRIRERVLGSSGRLGGSGDDGDVDGTSTSSADCDAGSIDALEYMRAELRTSDVVVNANLQILTDIFESSPFLARVLPGEYFSALEQIIQTYARNNLPAKLSSLTASAEDANNVHIQAVNQSVESMLFWCYSPWLMLPDTPLMYERTCSAALSERDCRFVFSTAQQVAAQSYLHREYENRWLNDEAEASEYQLALEAANEPQSRLRHTEVNRRAAREVHMQDKIQSADERWRNRRLRFKLDDEILMSAVVGANDSSSTSEVVIPSQISMGVSKVYHWCLANHEDRLRQRRVLVPNRSFDSHRNAAYGKDKAEESKSSQSMEGDVAGVTAPAPAVKMLRNPVERHSESEVSESEPESEMEGEDEDEKEHGDEEDEGEANEDAGNEGGESTNEMMPTRQCSEDDSFDDFTLINGTSVISPASLSFKSEKRGSLSLKKNNNRAFSLQRGERLLFSSVMCKHVDASEVIAGRLDISNCHLFFYPSREKFKHGGASAFSQVDSVSADGQAGRSPMEDAVYRNCRWRIDDIVGLYTRRYLLCNNAVEIFFSDQSTVFIVFGLGSHARAEALSHLLRLPLPKLSDTTRAAIAHAASKKKQKRKIQKRRRQQHELQSEYFSLAPSLAPSKLAKASGMTEMWQQRKMSNFDYIMHLNTMSGRSYNDITQYPVFPWVISDYTSSELDFGISPEARQSTFRDLSKPVGALNPSRLSSFLERYESFDEDLAGVPRFHYGR
jgi:hypothetical protein